jgi:tyrosyl-tRNA synthetase
MQNSTTNFNSKLLKTLSERQFIQDCTDYAGLDKLLSDAEANGKSVPIYIGFDMTAKSLHVGSLMQIMILRHIQLSGHKPIVLLGGGTTLIGDPSGRDETRQILTDEVIADNMNSINRVFAKYLNYGAGANDAATVNNADWLKNLNYIEFLRTFGRFFSVNKMLTYESVKRRLDREQNLSFLEFNYMIFQAYDFVELGKLYGVRAQIGGSDQWGNIVNGIELNRKLSTMWHIDNNSKEGRDHDRLNEEEFEKKYYDSIKLFGLTTPLLTTASGAKMGKTAAGAIWIDEEMLKPYDFWQFWRNTEDADVIKFLKLFTELSMAEIAELEKLEGAAINQAKIILANEVTKLAHGELAAISVAETAKKVFEQGELGGDLPVFEIEKATLEQGINVCSLFKESGLVESGGEAKRLIQGGGAKINDEKIIGVSEIITLKNLNADGVIKLSSGKKNHLIVKVK